jgi:hypothetical protein
MPSQWTFEQDEQAQWEWRSVDTEGESVQSSASFATQTACMLNAVRFAVQRRRSQSDTTKDDFSATITN